MRLPRVLPALISISIVFGAIGCAPRYVKSDGPVQADGVVVSLVAEDCRDETDEPQGGVPEDAAAPTDISALDLQLTLEVGNAGASPIIVDPHHVMLQVGGDLADPSTTDGVDSLPPGGKRVIQVRFHKASRQPCDETMQVVLNRMARMGAHEIPLRPVSFQPNHG
jgi:hypothetical protein